MKGPDLDDTAGQQLNEECHIENKERKSQKHDQSSIRKELLIEVQKVGAARLFGFLFWTNLAGVCLLLVGFVAPGWVTFRADQRLFYNEYSSRRTEVGYTYIYNIYQDYALWYITQCIISDDYSDVYETECETMSYRTISHLFKNKNADYSKIEIWNKIIEGNDICIFQGKGLVMSYSKIARAQAMYTVGSLLSFATLFILAGCRSQLANGKFKQMSRKKWILVFLLSVVSAVTTLVPVAMFASVRAEVFESIEDPDKFETSVGSTFAGIGGGLLTLMTFVVFLQMVCCRTPGTYICSLTDQSGASIEQ